MKQTLFFFTLLCISFQISKAAIGPKYNWGTNFGGTSGAEAVNAVKTDAAGNVYVAGKFTGTNVDFNFGAGTTLLSSSGTSSDIFLVKYNAQGQLLWAKVMGGTGEDEARAIAIDLSGNIWIAGTFTGTADLNPSATTSNLFANTSVDRDIFLAKYDTSGNYLWAGELNGNSPYEQVSGIAVNPTSSNISIIGTLVGTLDVSPGPLNIIITSAGNEDIFVANYNINGGYLNNIKLGGTGTDRGTGIAVDAASNIYISGQITGVVDFDFGSGNSNTTAQGADAFVAKYSSSYALQFVNVFGGALSFDMAYSVAVDNSGNVYTSGCFSGTADADPGSATVNVFTNNGGVTYGHVIKYNSTGAYQWVYTTRTSESVVSSIALDAAGDLYLASIAAGQFDADNTSSAYIINQGGAQSPVLIKLSNAGSLAWATALTCSSYGISNSVSVSNSGNVVVGGYFMGTADFDSSPNELIKTSLSNDNDCFVAYYAPCNFPSAPTLADESICSGQSIALSIPGAGTRSWYTTEKGNTYVFGNGFTISPTSNVTYYAQDSNACGSGPRTAKTVQVNTPPVVQASASQSVLCVGNTVTLTASGADTYLWNTLQTTSAIQLTPVLSDTLYAVIGASNNGCSDTAYLSLQVNPLPVLALSASSDTVCLGEEVNISSGSSASNSFLWSTGGASSSLVVAPASATTYSVTATNSFSCSATASLSIEVNSVDATVTNNTNTLTAQETSANYQWINCATGMDIAGANSQSYTATANGNYAVIVTGNNGCSDTSDCYSVVGLSVNEYTAQGVSIYPNPFTDYLSIDVLIGSEVFIEIANATGQTVRAEKLSNTQNRISTVALSPGFYTILVSTASTKVRYKLLKE